MTADVKTPTMFGVGFDHSVGGFTELRIGKSSYTKAEVIAALAAAERAPDATEPFQQRVQPWMMSCFGPEISADRIKRNHRFIEEALELVQATGCTKSEAHQLVDYVYSRPVGEPPQEVGGVMVTLAALCLANGYDMHEAGETELARIWTKVEKIRAKQAAKPKHSPLPEAAPDAGRESDSAELVARLKAYRDALVLPEPQDIGLNIGPNMLACRFDEAAARIEALERQLGEARGENNAYYKRIVAHADAAESALTEARAMTGRIAVESVINAARLIQAREENERLIAAINWAHGCNGDFRERGPKEGAFWWRTELRERSGLVYDSEAGVYRARAATFQIRVGREHPKHGPHDPRDDSASM